MTKPGQMQIFFFHHSYLIRDIYLAQMQQIKAHQRWGRSWWKNSGLHWYTTCINDLLCIFIYLNKKGNLFRIAWFWISARDWNRTSTSLRTADFESAASTNSATRAGGFKFWKYVQGFWPQTSNLKIQTTLGLQYYDIPFNCCWIRWRYFFL